MEGLVEVREKLGERDRERDSVNQDNPSPEEQLCDVLLSKQMHFPENSKMPPNNLLDTKPCLATP